MSLDTLAGGAGMDTADDATFFPTNGRIGVAVNLASGEAVGDGTGTLTQIKNVDGSVFDDRLVGNGQANQLRGRDGKDRIVGAGGQDRLRGGDGSDTILARDGTRDDVFGDKARDRAQVDPGLDVLRGIEDRF
jgi:Ca2+-binding RTX toxin-like protein